MKTTTTGSLTKISKISNTVKFNKINLQHKFINKKIKIKNMNMNMNRNKKIKNMRNKSLKIRGKYKF